MNEGRPESKDRLCIVLMQVIHNTVQIWSQAIFTCSQHWRNFMVARHFKSNEEVKDAFKQKHTKTRHTVWQVPYAGGDYVEK